MKRLLLSLLICCTWQVATAQTVDEIIIRSTTDTAVSEQLVRSNMSLQAGAPFSPRSLSEDIKALYRTGQFQDIQVREEVQADGDLRLILEITPKQIVQEIQFVGNRNLKDKALRKRLNHLEGQLLDNSRLAEDLAELYKYYQDKGYYDVRIRQQIEPATDGGVKVVYEIDEQVHAKTRDLEIVGNEAFWDWQILWMMGTDVSLWGYVLPVGYFNPQEFREDLDKVVEAYWNEGYLDVQVTYEQTFNEDQDKTFITVYIEEGERYDVSAVSIAGNEKLSDETVMDQVRLGAGDQWTLEMEQDDVQRITDRYYRDGFLDVRVDAIRRPDSQTHKVAITYQIEEGVASRIRNINVSGNRITKDKVIRRELQIVPGDKSDGAKLDASRSRLRQLGYFSQVDIIPLSTGDPKLKDLEIQVTEQDTGRLSLGAGFSSSSDVVGTVELAQTNFDLMNPPWFRGGGQRMRLRSTLGTSVQEYRLTFTEPWLFDHRLRLNYDFWKSTITSNRSWEQDSIGSSIILTRPLQWHYWRQSFGYRIEFIEINDIDNDFSPEFRNFEEGDELVSALIYNMTRDHRDRQLNPTTGNILRLRSELQSEAIGSYSDLYKLRLSGAQYYPIIFGGSFKLEGEVAQLNPIGSEDPKVFDRLFAGGINSIRGFEEREVGPKDSRNLDPIGGRSRMLFTVEYLQPLYEETVYAAVWSDAGNVWADEWDYTFDEINVGAGLGIRLYLPVGAFQLDYGWPIHREDERLSSSGRFHFSLGYTF